MPINLCISEGEMKTVITYGTFDLFHIGHLNLIERLRGLGDRLIVACSTDEFNNLKGKQTIVPFAQRVEILKSIRYVDKVIPEKSWDQKRQDIIREKAVIFAMGDDWSGKFDELGDICQVLYLPRTENVSTSEIRQVVTSLQSEKLSELRRTIEKALNLVNRL